MANRKDIPKMPLNRLSPLRNERPMVGARNKSNSNTDTPAYVKPLSGNALKDLIIGVPPSDLPINNTDSLINEIPLQSKPSSEPFFNDCARSCH